MKHFKLFFALFAMLALGVGNAWGAEKTITLTYSDFGLTTSYAQKTATVDGIGFTVNQGYKGSGNVIQMNSSKGAGVLYNTTSIAGLKSITVNVSSGSKQYTITSGTAQTPSGNSQTGTATKTFSIPSGDTYFQLKVSGASYFSSIVITYDDSNSGGETPGTGGETPEPEPDPTPDPGTGGELVGEQTAMYVVSTATAVTTSGIVPDGSSASLSGTGSLSSGFIQCTNGKNHTLTLKGYAGYKIKSISIHVKSNSSKGTGSFSVVAGSTTIASIAESAFNTANWNGSWNNSGVDKVLTMTNDSYEIQSGEDVKLTINCKSGSSNYNSLYIKSYTIVYESTSTGGETPEPETPATELTDAQFAWSAATAEATMGTTNTLPTLTNTLGLTVTYDSSNKDAATIAADGTITLLAPGTTTISAKFAGGEVSGTTYAAKTVTYALTVLKAPATPTSTVYVKVTSTAGITDGEYLIVYEDAEGNPKAPVAFDGSLAPVKLDVASNNIEVSIASNTIAGNTDIDAATFTINTAAGTIQTKDGYYIGQTSNANGLATSTTTEYTNTISIENDGSATITSGGAYLRYNSDANQWRFRYYKSGSYSSQKAITLYKKTNGQQLAGLAYATTKYLTKLGDAFTTPTLTNPNSLTVTYSSSDDNVATVAADGAVTIKAAGVVVITAAFAGDASYLEGSAKYTLCVTEHAGTEADPYSVADARRVIDVMETAEGVYAKGLVSEIVTAYNSEYGNITYNISVDGTTTGDQLQAYRGKSYNGANFTSADDVKVGDEVVIKGTLKKYSTTYEFDAGNQLVSLNRTKEQAGLAYAETEHTANVGEDFAEPALTNPNNLTVTYSSSNTTLATVNATTGEVTILAAGKVTITATTAGDATYAAGSASYNITITNPGLAVATLPFYFDGKRADIESTAGMTHEGIDSDYSAKPYLKFNTAGDWAIVQFDSEPGEFSFLLKQNGSNAGTFTVYESANGEEYTSVWSGGDLGGNGKSATIESTLSATARYVKFEYTTKGASTNYGLGEISIKKADHRADAGLAWNPATVSLTVGDAFTAPTLSNPNSLTVSFESSNTALATVDNAGAISLVSGKTGTATITATFADGDATYKAAEVTCVITVNPKSEKVVILAEYNGQWYALKNVEQTAGKVIAALPVNYVGGKLYNVADEAKATIEWQLAIDGTIATFKNGENYISGTAGSTDLKLSTTECTWTLDGSTYKIGNRTFIYRAQANGFKNYNVTTTPGTDDYSNLPVVTAPVYATGDAYGRTVTTGEYGTICIPYGSSNYTGAEFYEISWMEMDGTNPKGIWLDEVNGNLTAGKPYIFKATASEIAIVGDGTTAAAPVVGVAGLTGTFTLIQDLETSDPSNTLEGNYMISGNEFLQCGTGCWLNANRAYIDATIIANHTTKKEKIPGRRRVCLGETSENTTTGVDNNQLPNANIQKVIENGQFIIIRDGVKYNVQGQVIR